jgi:hypothetical protein
MRLSQARAVWEELAHQFGGEFQCVDAFGGNPFFKVTAKLDHWTVKLDSRGYGRHLSMGTRVRACYVSLDDFRFSVRHAGLISRPIALFGLKNRYSGNPSFDDRFVVHTNNEPQIRKLLSCPVVQERLLVAPRHICLQARDQDEEYPSLLPKGIDQLYIRDKILITDLHTLRKLFELFQAVLQQLVEICSITTHDPLINF